MTMTETFAVATLWVSLLLVITSLLAYGRANLIEKRVYELIEKFYELIEKFNNIVGEDIHHEGTDTD